MFLGVVTLLLRWFRKIDNRLYVYYLMHDYSYSAATKGANPPELEARMAVFADRIARALTTDVDEVLVVGHSSGAHLGVSILADLIRDGRLPEKGGPKLGGFLTLGQVVPMVSFLPDAHRLRRDLHDLSQAREVAWVDVTAPPGDGCAFALCDPVSVSGGAAPPNGQALASGDLGGLYPDAQPGPLGRAALALFPAAFSVSLRFRPAEGL